jgi:hypothetical protein
LPLSSSEPRGPRRFRIACATCIIPTPNQEARRAQGLDALTLRWFGMSLPPDEDWVVLTYLDANGAVQESRFEWDVIEPETLQQLHADGDASAERRARLGVDVKTELLRRVRKALFDPPAVKAEADMAAYRHQRSRAGGAAGRAPAPPRAGVSVLRAVYPHFGPATTPSGLSACSKNGVRDGTRLHLIFPKGQRVRPTVARRLDRERAGLLGGLGGHPAHR